MKQWTKTELKGAKLKIRMEYKMGKLSMTTKDLILRPSEMDEGDFELLLNLFETYGKSK